MEPKHVLVFGAFDLFHQGHRDFFQQAKEHGDYLTVVVGRDQTIKRHKGRFPVQSEKIRLQRISRVPVVDQAILGYPSETIKDQLRIVEDLKPAVICLGYDQKPTANQLKSLLAKRGLSQVKVVTLKPYQPEKYKSSKLRQHQE